MLPLSIYDSPQEGKLPKEALDDSSLSSLDIWRENFLVILSFLDV